MNLDAVSKALHFHGRDFVQSLLSQPAASAEVRQACRQVLADMPPASSWSSSFCGTEPWSSRPLVPRDECHVRDETRAFLLSHFEKVFHRTAASATATTAGRDDGEGAESVSPSDCEVCASVPSLDEFVPLSRRRRLSKLFEDVCIGDVVCAEVLTCDDRGITVRLLCVADGPQRIIKGLDVQAFIPSADLSECMERPEQLHSVYRKYRIMRAAVRAKDTAKCTFTLSTSSRHTASSLALGIICEDDLPSYFSMTEYETHDDYERILRHSKGFKNVSCVSNLCRRFKLNETALHSFHFHFDGCDFREENRWKHLRICQSRKIANERVTKGVERLRQGLSTEALQLFNKALEVDPANIDALVARGALYANTDCFTLAVKDFEEALLLDSAHVNARKYMLETLQTEAKILEKRGKWDRAARLYRKMLTLDGDHEETLQRLKKLSAKEAHKKRKNEASSEESESENTKKVKSDSKTSMEELKTKILKFYQQSGCDFQDSKEFLSNSQMLVKLKQYYEEYSKENDRRMSEPRSKDRDSSSKADNTDGSTTSESSSSQSGSGDSESATASDSDSGTRDSSSSGTRDNSSSGDSSSSSSTPSCSRASSSTVTGSDRSGHRASTNGSSSSASSSSSSSSSSASASPSATSSSSVHRGKSESPALVRIRSPHERQSRFGNHDARNKEQVGTSGPGSDRKIPSKNGRRESNTKTDLFSKNQKISSSLKPVQNLPAMRAAVTRSLAGEVRTQQDCAVAKSPTDEMLLRNKLLKMNRFIAELKSKVKK